MGKQVKEGGILLDLLLGGGASVSEAPPSFSYPTPRAKTPRGLEPRFRKQCDSIIYRYEGAQYIQVTFKGRGCQGKEGECEGWTWRDIPLKSNTDRVLLMCY